MTASSSSRGWLIQYINNQWVYIDNQKKLSNQRLCKKCGKSPTKDGHDACLGLLPNTISACCGHGIEPSLQTKQETQNEKSYCS